MSNKIKFAIVGCGSIGKRHIAVLDAEPEAEIVAICDVDEKKCIEQSALYQNIPYYTSYEKMLSEIKADVINIVTPHALHAPMAIAAANHQFNVLVEKPMALTMTDCNRMNEAADKNNVKLWVVKQNRHNVPVKLTKDAIDKGMLGKIFMIKCDILWNRYQGYYDESPWRGKKNEEGGALFTQASHFIDLLVWWCGDVTEVKAMMETQNHNIQTEDSGSAVLKFSSGTLGSINWTTCVYNKNYEGSITIVGEFGTIKIGGQYLNKIEFWDVRGYPLQEGIEFTDKPNAYGKYQGTSSNHDKVIKTIIGTLENKNVSVSAVEGFEGMRCVDAIEKMYNSLKSK
ncbi:MAG TPA: Gfo/Idh/MocA family oxidoreductase [Bacteroidia bacterium]|nr:Gfo/Idh/MocA family oxidoreductase [Bacteroidia bacterium]